MTTRTPNRTASTGVFYTGSPDYVDVSSATAESGMVTFEDRAVADSWADGDSVVVVVYVDDDNYKVCPATWDETNSYLLLGTAEESVGTIANSTAVVVTATLSNTLLEAGLVSSYPDLLGLDQGGNARGTDAVNLQSDRSSTSQVASGSDAVAIGANTKASGSSSIAVGAAAYATDNGAVSIGSYTLASETSAVAVGDGATAEGGGAIAIGTSTTSSGDAAVAVGESTSATSNDSIAVGNGATAGGDDSIACGTGAWVGGRSSIAVGDGAQANVDSGESSIAIGPDARTFGSSSIAIGDGAEAMGASAIAFGNGRAFAEGEITAAGFFAVPLNYNVNHVEIQSAGTQSVFATPVIELGVPPVWQASTSYDHGKVIQPTTGGSVQYRALCGYDSSTLLHNSATSDATEPTWPGADGVVSNGTDTVLWVGLDPVTGYETMALPNWLEFWPSSIAFICQEYSTTTGTPTISIGTAASPTLILNAAAVSISAVGQIYQFTIPNPCQRIPEGESILVTLEGAASAGVMVGRFVFTGVFVATRSRT